MLGGQRSHVIIERAEEGEPGDEARDLPETTAFKSYAAKHERKSQ